MLNYTIINLVKKHTATHGGVDKFIFCGGFSHGAASAVPQAASRCGLISFDGLSIDLTSFSASYSFPLFVPPSHKAGYPGSANCSPPLLCVVLFFPCLYFPRLSILHYFFNFFMSPASLFRSPHLQSTLLIYSFLPERMKPSRGEHDKQTPFHWTPKVTFPSWLYQHGNAAL